MNLLPNNYIRSGPILLLADQAWDSSGGGAVILRSLLAEGLVRNGVVWVTPSRVDQDLCRGHYGLISGSAGNGRFSVLKDILWNANRLACEVRMLASQVDAAGVWSVLHGATVAITAKLVKASDLPIHATVHDDPVYATALRSRRLALFAPLIALHFRNALKAACSVDVVCDPMAVRYQRKYGVKSVVLHRGLPESVQPSPAYDLKGDGLTIGILGNTYGYRQLKTLGRAVELAAARLGVQPRIVICGQNQGERLKRDLIGRVEVEVKGHLDERAGIDRLRRCAMLYLNYPFGLSGRVLRETSFPTKLSTYVYAARPILIHAPSGSSISGLAAAYGDYVVKWDSMDPIDGAGRIITYMADSLAKESFHASADAVRLRYYDHRTHRATLDRIIQGLAARTSEIPGKSTCA